MDNPCEWCKASSEEMDSMEHEMEELKLQLSLMTSSRDHAKTLLDSCEKALEDRDESSYEFMRTIELMINPAGVEVPYKGDFILHLKQYIDYAETSAKMVSMLEAQKDSVKDLITKFRSYENVEDDWCADQLEKLFKDQ